MAYGSMQLNFTKNHGIDGSDYKIPHEEFENPNGSIKPQIEPKSVHVHTKVQSNSGASSGAGGGDQSLHVHTKPQSILPYVKILEQLSPKIKEKLLTLLEKGIDLNELIEQMLQNREAEIEEAKHVIVQEMEVKAAKKPSRYIPVKIKKIIKLEQGTKCSFPACNNPSENIHHTQRFALTQNHNPFFLAQSCRNHHEIAHTIDQKYQEKRKRPIR